MTPFERWWNRPTQLAGEKEVPLWQLLSDDRKTACDTAYMAGVNSTARRLEVAQRMADALRELVALDDGDVPALWPFHDKFALGEQVLAEWDATR